MDKLQIRVCQYYRMRNGTVVGPAKWTGFKKYPWKIGNISYTREGLFSDDGTISDLDIVSEVFVFDVASQQEPLRDKFAMAAMVALSHKDVYNAVEAYDYADAMLSMCAPTKRTRNGN